MKKTALLLILFAFTSCDYGTYTCTKEIKNDTEHTIHLIFIHENYPYKSETITIKPFGKWTQKNSYYHSGPNHDSLLIAATDLVNLIFDGDRAIDLEDPDNIELKYIDNVHYFSKRWSKPEEGRHYHLFTFTEDDYNKSIKIP